jgi:hypothetical protein
MEKLVTRILSMIALVGAIASPVSAQEGEEPHASPARAALVGLAAGSASLQAYDVYTTLAALNRGAVEANPAMRAVARRPAALVAVKAGVATSSILASAHLWKQHHRKAAVLLLGITNGAVRLYGLDTATPRDSSRRCDGRAPCG